MFSFILGFVQLAFTIVIGLYFWGQLRGQQADQKGIKEDTKVELERLHAMRRISLTQPLTEKTRPQNLAEIIGQDAGVKAVKVGLCGPNPQHILIYGPPGVGKTAASRVALEAAKKSSISPFGKDAKFIEVDATIMHYDERSIADPLIGSVHDPIYQGAGAYGQAGVPQPKPGAVSKAHGGVLFIDEIGELQPTQMNRLLKVLEDRKVNFESAYYSSTNKNIPRHVHDMFQNGLPADFRLIGATTRSPEEIPPALRSRCMEVFFNGLEKEDLEKILDNAIKKLDITMEKGCRDMICSYAKNGRDTVRILEILSGKLALEDRSHATLADVEWVIETGRYTPVYTHMVAQEAKVGVANGLAVADGGSGILMPIEVTARKADKEDGSALCTGIMERETINRGPLSLTRTGTAKAAVHNVMTVLKNIYGIHTELYDLHINFAGGMPVDGPSAGVAMLVACYSAICNLPVAGDVAFTGEVSIHGWIKPVGGVSAKVEAARRSGAKTVFIPKQNYQKKFAGCGIAVIPVESVQDVFQKLFEKTEERVIDIAPAEVTTGLASARGEE